MTCFHPLQAYKLGSKPNGKASIVFKFPIGVDLVEELKVPCGRCIGCRLERSRQWAVRCLHESKSHEDNCFITLTYDDEHLPRDRSLDVKVFQDFVKRMRKKVGKFRYFHCGEYGEKEFRPHFHACIFGYDFPDKKFLKRTNTGSNLYRSDILEKLWTFGFSSIGSVTFESAAYVARYIVKKVNGIEAESHYLNMNNFVCEDTGEIYPKKPEYTTMSRRPGIGSIWFDKFQSDVFPSDEVIVRGKQMRPPKYYDGKLEMINPGLFEVIKASRVEEAEKYSHDQTPERLLVREKCKLAKLGLYKRDVE